MSPGSASSSAPSCAWTSPKPSAAMRPRKSGLACSIRFSYNRDMKTTIGVNGACGRMGQRIIQLAHEDKELAIGAALEAPAHTQQGRDVGEMAGVGKLGVPVRPVLAHDLKLDVFIDFSLPEGTMMVLPWCVQRRVPIVIATTGHTMTQRQEIEAAAGQIAVLMAPNMSLGVNLIM